MATGIRINGAKNFAGELYATQPWVLKYLEGLGLGTDFKWSEILKGINDNIAAAKDAADAAQDAADAAQGTADSAIASFGTMAANKIATANAEGTALEYINSIVTSIGEVGEDNNIATEKAVRSAIKAAVDAVTAEAISVAEGNGISITSSGTTNVISIEVAEGEKVLVLDEKGLKSGISLKALTVPTDDPNAANISKRYALVGADGETQLGDVVIDIPKDQFLKDAKYDSVTHKLTFTFNVADGTAIEEIDLKGLMNVYKAGNGLEGRTVEGEEYFDVKIDSASEKVVTGEGTTADVLTVSADGVKASNVQAAIDYAVATEAAAIKEVAIKLVEVPVAVPAGQTGVFTATVAGRVISVYGAEGVIYPEIKYAEGNSTLTADFGELVVEAGETWTAVVAKPLASN